MIVSNKTIKSILESDPVGQASSYDARVGQTLNASLSITCTKCGAEKVAHSRRQRFDDLKMRFMAKRPYRCLHCYHRFWVAEKITDNGKRVWTLVIIALLSTLLLLKISGVFNASKPDEIISIVVPEFNPSVTPDETSPSLASLINMPQTYGDSDAATNAPTPVTEVIASPSIASQAEESSTPEQKARRLLLAKQESEVAEKMSQARVEQLEQVLSPVEDELESLVKIEVGYVVERWRDAWSKGDIDTYLLSYSADFRPANDLAFDAWVASRKYRVKPEKNINVELNDFDITMLEEMGSGVIEFNQRYQSGDYVESSRKRLELVKEQGSWKIVSEVELN